MHRPEETRRPTASTVAASSVASSGRRFLARLPDRLPVLSVSASRLIAWQLLAVAGVAALALRGPAQWALGAVALLGVWLTVPRWRRRGACEWLLTALGFRRASRMRAASPARLPLIDVTPVRVRGGQEAGIAHDGDGFAVILAVAAVTGSPPVTELPVAALAGLLDPQDTLVSAVQVVMHSDLAASGETSGPAAAYRNLGHHRVPRSQSTWVVLRHDPAASGYAVGTAGTSRDLHASLLRSLAGRAIRGARLFDDLGLRGSLLDAEAARELVHRALLAPEPASPDIVAAAGPPPRQWGSWHSATRRHVTYSLARWPAARHGIPAARHGIHVLQEALAAVPALSVTTAVVLTCENRGRIRLTATVRVAMSPGADETAVTVAVRTAAESCGARLIRLDGEHAAGVLATLPLGRWPETAGRRRSHWDGSHSGGGRRSPAAVMPVAGGGVVLGAESGGDPVAVPFFTAERGTRAAVIGDPALPQLLALRAIGAGARLQVVTSQPAGWLKLRSHARLPPGSLAVVRPGTQPPSDGTRISPWMIIDDTGSPAAAGCRPWQSAVTVSGEVSAIAGALSGLDAVLLQRTSQNGAATVVAALGLPASCTQSLQLLPDGVVAAAVPGAVRFARLALDELEPVVLAGSVRPGEPPQAAASR